MSWIENHSKPDLNRFSKIWTWPKCHEKWHLRFNSVQILNFTFNSSASNVLNSKGHVRTPISNESDKSLRRPSISVQKYDYKYLLYSIYTVYFIIKTIQNGQMSVDRGSKCTTISEFLYEKVAFRRVFGGVDIVSAYNLMEPGKICLPTFLFCQMFLPFATRFYFLCLGCGLFLRLVYACVYDK